MLIGGGRGGRREEGPSSPSRRQKVRQIRCQMIFNVKRAPSFFRDTFLLGAALRGADTHIAAAAAARSGSHHALRERGTTPPGRGRPKMGEEEEGNGAAESIGDGKSGSRAGGRGVN